MCEIKIKLAAGTNVGLVRKNNEDNFIVNKDLCQNDWFIPDTEEDITLSKYGCVLAVADGMGGANAGEVASAIAIDTVQKSFTPENLAKIITDDTDSPSETDIRDFLTKIIKDADVNILNKSQEDSSTEGMGTTIVIAWLLKDKAYIAWCGDSRCYVFNSDAGISRLSKDHSFVQELVDQGKLDEENAFDYPYSNIITRCLGDPNQRSVPDFRTYKLKDNDILLLCSDGLCGLCRDEEIIQVISNGLNDLNGLRDNLIDAALSEGGYDNVTVALCQVCTNTEMAEADKVSNKTLKSHKRRFVKALPFIFLLLIVAGIYFYKQFPSAHPQDDKQVQITDTISPAKQDSVIVPNDL